MSFTDQYPANGSKTLSQILERVFQLLRANLKLFVGIATVQPAAFIVSIGLVFGGFVIPLYGRMPRNPSPAQDAQFGFIVLPAMMVVFLIHGVALAPCFAAASDASVRADLGIHLTFREAYANAFRRFWRLLLLLILIFAISMGPLIVLQLAVSLIGILVGRGNSAGGGALFVFIPIGILLVLACFAFSIVMQLRLSLAFPACVTENLTALSALRRSSQLTRGAKGRIFVVLLVVYAAVNIAYFLTFFSAVFVFAIGALVGSLFHFHAPVVVNAIVVGLLAVTILGVMVLFMAGSWAGYATALGVIYNDQRIRVDRPPASLPNGGTPADGAKIIRLYYDDRMRN